MRRLRSCFLFLLQSATTLGVKLYAAGTRGTVTTLSLDIGGDFSATLTRRDTSNECGGAPSWLTLDRDNQVLYCIDDTTSGRGSIHSFDISSDGELIHVDSIKTPVGPVSSTLYGRPDYQRLAVAF
jgi:6-phosphogluconolactonase (cycloisomerase 2 family)